MEKINGGFIILARKVLLSELWSKPPLYMKIWVWLMQNAAYIDGWKGLKRGQVKASYNEIAKALTYYVGARKCVPTLRNVRTVLWAFSESHAVSLSGATGGMLITILNYDYYQNPLNYKSLSKVTPKVTSKVTSLVAPYNKDKEGNEINNTPLPPKGENAVAEIEILKTRYPHPEIIESGLSAIASTRKANKIALSIILTTLKLWAKEPVENVEGGIREYVARNYAADGKSERYLLAMIKNHKPKAPEQSRGVVPISVAPPGWKG